MSSLSIDQSAPYNIGEKITFSFEQNSTAHPWVHVVCKQNGNIVYEEFHGGGDDPHGPFTLGPTNSWQSGSADGHAELLNRDNYPKSGKNKVLAKIDFSVD
jgi:hypothetical protein